jgi:hypothetical protein
LHEELCNVNCSPNVIGMIKSRSMRAGQVGHMGEMRNAYKILVSKPHEEFWWED